jgi:hypothetical protein
MQGTLLELRDKAVSQDLKERLMMAVAKVAVEVYTDAEETQQHKAYAVQVAKSPRSIAERMTPVVVVLAANDSDDALEVAVKAVFNVYASEVQVEPTI